MERINEYYFYSLAGSLLPLRDLTAEMDNWAAVQILYPAFLALRQIESGADIPLPICTDSARRLREAMEGPINEIMGRSPIPGPSVITVQHVVSIQNELQRFETVLSVQLDQIDSYRVTQKGTHDTRKLIASPASSFPVTVWGQLPENAQRDWVSAAKCLAFDVSTACGFHAIRALEAVALHYLKTLKVEPKKRDLGHYLELLRENDANPKAVEAADQLRGLHRNPLMHPEDFLEIDDALDVFDLCKSAIKALLRDMNKRGLIPNESADLGTPAPIEGFAGYLSVP